MPRLPQPDFFNFGVDVFVCNERAVELAGDAMEMAGELLPVTIKAEAGRFHIFNVTNCVDVIDPKKSEWEDLGMFKGKPLGRILREPVFNPQWLGEAGLFKIPEHASSEIYCLERTGDAENGEFKALVEHHGLTGLTFELIWSGRRSPGRKRK